MKVQLHGDFKNIEAGMVNLLNYHTCNAKDIDLTVSKLNNDAPISLSVSTKNGYKIEYKEVSNFFKAFAILLENIDNDDFYKEETAIFEGCSTMIDLSRNAVHTVEYMKKMMSYMALCGHNRCYLYMEDTYELPGYDYFGYLRGKYSLKELKELDDFAFSLGIEAIPCIQTLAHLRTTLKWSYAANMKDADDVLMVGSEETEKFIETMITTLKAIFRTDKMHIGMDEAMNLGTGKYLRKYGYKSQFELMLEHLDKVCGICRKHGIKPLIWDDMFYRSLDVNHEYYNLNIDMTEEHINAVPSDVALVYWDYYHNTEKDYDELLNFRDKFKNDIVFAGGIWRWMGYIPHYSKTIVTTNAALNMCKNHNIKEIMATAWGDDGAETPIQTLVPGLILYGEHCFGGDTSNEAISKRVYTLTGHTLEEFLAIENLDILPGCENPNIKTRNPSKHILFGDLFLGAFDKYFEEHDYITHFSNCSKELAEIASKQTEFTDLFKMYSALADVLGIKATLGIRIRNAYKAGDKAALTDIYTNDMTRLTEAVKVFKEAFKKIWFDENKGHGFEVIDVRHGGLLSRIETCAERLKKYCDGEITLIEELEEIILPYELGGYPEGPYICYNKYLNIVTQNLIGQ